MAQPSAYNRSHDFTLDEQGQISTHDINKEFDEASLSINQIRERLALIQLDDGRLALGIVGMDQLGADVIAKFQSVVTDAASKANESAQRAIVAADKSEEIQISVQVSEGNVVRLEESTRINAELVKDNAELVHGYVLQIDPAVQNIEEILTLVDHLDEVTTVAPAVDSIGVISQDLKGALCNDGSIISYGRVTDEPDPQYCIEGGNIVDVADEINNVRIVGVNIDKVISVADSIEKLPGVMMEVQKNADEAKKAAKTAAFAYRFSTELIKAASDIPLSNLTPQDNVKVGDHLVDPSGAVYQITAMTETSFSVGEKLTSLQGPKGDTGTTDFNELQNKPILGDLASKDKITAEDLADVISLGRVA